MNLNWLDKWCIFEMMDDLNNPFKIHTPFVLPKMLFILFYTRIRFNKYCNG